MLKKIFIFAIIFGLGFFAAWKLKPSFQDGWETAGNRAIKYDFLSANIGEDFEVKEISGQVKKIKDDEITIEIKPLNPFDNPDLDARIIKIGDATKIYQAVPKDETQLQKEMDEFNRNFKQLMDSAKDPSSVQPPESYIKQEVGLDKIKIGKNIFVISSENIRNAKKFVASEIVVQ